MNEPLTEVEAEIKRRLLKTKEVADKYVAVRKTENNLRLMEAVQNFVMAEVMSAPRPNIPQPYTGILTVSDIRCLRMDHEEGLYMTQEMAERLLLFRLVEVYEQQTDVHVADTLCFKLNTCGITEKSQPRYAVVERQFNDVFKKDTTVDIFTKKFLVFPNWFKDFGFLTLVLNPMGAVKRENGRRSKNKCYIVHIGVKNRMLDYTNQVELRLIHLMKQFRELHGEAKGYESIEYDQIKEKVENIDHVHKHNRPFQLLLLIEQMLHSEKPLNKYNHILKKFKTSPYTTPRIGYFRDYMLGTVMSGIQNGTDEARKHLLKKVNRTGEFFKKERIEKEKQLAATSDAPQSDNEGPPPSKRLRPIETITLD